ncbi:MAG: hypothetical protein JO333_07080 [Verrucomicrobia bacterium]|nr:hypothetical protein [Verrucomicrobiota bacterium]
MTGDLSDATTLEIFAPASVNSVTWNGSPVNARRTAFGTLAASLEGPHPIQLPPLVDWKFYPKSLNYWM